jgi:hypothetical protein
MRLYIPGMHAVLATRLGPVVAHRSLLGVFDTLLPDSRGSYQHLPIGMSVDADMSFNMGGPHQKCAVQEQMVPRLNCVMGERASVTASQAVRRLNLAGQSPDP